MEEKQIFVPDTACRCFSSGSGWKNAPVLCRREEIRAGKCASCGFNPAVKMKRLVKAVGLEAAWAACQKSDALSIEWHQLMQEGENG